jgi:putative endonuclease
MAAIHSPSMILLESEICDAIAREKQIKGWSRKKKDVLINQMNPQWDDLYDIVL